MKEELYSLSTETKKPKNEVFYRCERPSGANFGISDDGVIISGLALVHYVSTEFDFVDEDVSNLGAEASFIISEALVEGGVYRATMTNLSRDWETGHVEDWSVQFDLVTDPAELERIETLRASMAAEYSEPEEVASFISNPESETIARADADGVYEGSVSSLTSR